MLSGGEQQMLTICRSLLGNPRVIFVAIRVRAAARPSVASAP
jgi:ABC-type branched-subunit amino acid transport system ATPase component